jgi:hypothetical protein
MANRLNEPMFTDDELAYLDVNYPEHAKVAHWIADGTPGFQETTRHPPPRDEADEAKAVGFMNAKGARLTGVSDGETFNRLFTEALMIGHLLRERDKYGQEWFDEGFQTLHQQ